MHVQDLTLQGCFLILLLRVEGLSVLNENPILRGGLQLVCKLILIQCSARRSMTWKLEACSSQTLRIYFTED